MELIISVYVVTKIIEITIKNNPIKNKFLIIAFFSLEMKKRSAKLTPRKKS